MDKELLIDLIRQTNLFFEPYKHPVRTVHSQIAYLGEIMNQHVSEVSAGFSTGYPFYAVTEEQGQPVSVPEIRDFLGTVRRIILTDRNLSQDLPWACLVCEQSKILPDFKTECKPCQNTELKPRTIMKALPDLDIELVCDDPTPSILASIKTVVENAGFYSSDVSIKKTMDLTFQFLSQVNSQSPTPPHKIPMLPIDLHVWKHHDLMDSLDSIIQSKGRNSNVIIPTISLHKEWEKDEINLWFDLFQLTPYTKIDDARLNQQFCMARTTLANTWLPQFDHLITTITSLSERHHKLFQPAQLQSSLHQRLKRWATDPRH